MSSSASREWITSGSCVARAAAMWVRKPCSCASRGLNCRSDSRARPRRSPPPSDGRARDQIGGRDVEFLVRVVRMRADRARNVRKALGDREHLRVAAHAGRDRHHAADAGRLGARHHGVELGREVRENRDGNGCRPASAVQPALRLPARHSAGTPARARGSVVPGAMPRRPPPSAAKSALRLRNSQQIEQLRGRCWHERLRQDRDLPDHLGGDVEHRALPRRIGLGERPRRLAREIAVGVRHHGPDRVEHLMERLRLHRLARLADHARRRPRGSPGRSSLNAPGFGSTPPSCLPTIDSERCARLPRSLARSALMRLTIASWL